MDRVVSQPTPTYAEQRARARRVKLVITDVDGTLTDGTVLYSANGEELKRFDLRDGMGVELLRNAGIETVFLTRESSPIVAARARKLHVRVYGGVTDKLSALSTILTDTALTFAEVAYIGDDVNDLQALQLVGTVGLTAAPANAMPAVAAAAHRRLAERGGDGAFRAFADLILALRTDDQGQQP